VPVRETRIMGSERVPGWAMDTEAGPNRPSGDEKEVDEGGGSDVEGGPATVSLCSSLPCAVHEGAVGGTTLPLEVLDPASGSGAPVPWPWLWLWTCRTKGSLTHASTILRVTDGETSQFCRPWLNSDTPIPSAPPSRSRTAASGT